MCVARSPEGRVAAKWVLASAPPPHMSDEEGQGNPPGIHAVPAVLKEEGTVPPMPLGAFVKEEEIPSIPPGAFFNIKEEVVVKREHALIVDEGGRSDGRPKSAKVEGTSVDSFQMTIITCIAVFEASHANCKVFWFTCSDHNAQTQTTEQTRQRAATASAETHQLSSSSALI